MSKTIALHGSKDLLIQARQDLVKAGFKDDTKWNDRVSKWVIRPVSNLWVVDGMVEFHNYCDRADIVHDLTPENYAETIQSIILKKDELCQTN